MSPMLAPAGPPTLREVLHHALDELPEQTLVALAGALLRADAELRKDFLAAVLSSSDRHLHQLLTAPPVDQVVRDPELLEGQAAFAGTRVPVWVLFNYLTDEHSLAAFTDAYPQVSREVAIAVLDAACRALTGQSSHGDEETASPPRGRRRAGG
jgi:uncharacterized protein (DUF433 family)